jgi:CAAX prenyl protease-like protein
MQFWSQHRLTIALVAPLVAFFALGSLFSNLLPYEILQVDRPVEIDGNRYLALVAARVVTMGILIGLFFRLTAKSFPLRVDAWGAAAGVLGTALWIGLCELKIESMIVSLFGMANDALGARDAVNPFRVYQDSGLVTFLTFRFMLLVIMVPIAEELFLRGFLMRAVDCQDWQRLPLTQIGSAGLVAGTVYGVASHPSEAIAAAVWFSLVTLLMVKTGKFWNCVLAHAITNLLLGVYVCMTGNWHLW